MQEPHPPGISEVRQSKLHIRNQYEIGISHSSNGRKEDNNFEGGYMKQRKDTNLSSLCFTPAGDKGTKSVFRI